ncbi:hypothetical protein [Dinghuibacter silviterrae]|uniref:Uncharacterized protein n=1 Tax=Dinghuibacter silviterrae TaxID=1539049 RepID=A0A4R8DFK1_9BACT|nr:hypothetical protein [Dinghuibacter silviterrae]TDW96245.1 hypothetical protein EDB95_4070 [Dinghuibacter silviterrae]
MWKTLQPGDNIAVGDTVRYQTSDYSRVPRDEVYQVVKRDQHYFEIRLQPAAEDSRRKAIRYIDVGYTLRLEKWCDG